MVTNRYFTNYRGIRSAYSISLHKCIMCPTCDNCDISPLCSANQETCRAQRCHVHHVTFVLCKSRNFRSTKVHLPHVTFVQSLFATSWTKLDMSPKCVCQFSTKTEENNWKFLCTGKAWLILVTWLQIVQMTKNWTCHLCALNSRFDPWCCRYQRVCNKQRRL